MGSHRNGRVRFYLFTLLLAVVVLVASCSARNSSFSSLAEKGIVPVSTDNPYVGANLYLAKEMEDSLYLYNFLRSRGSPRAIEIVGSSEKSAELSLFYPAKREVYRATPQRDPLTQAKEWIIRGPYAVDREQHRSLTGLGTETSGVFEVFGRREQIGGASQAAQVRVLEPAFVPTPAPTPIPRPRRKIVRPAPASDVSSQGPAITIQGTPMNLDQQAIVEARKAVPTAPAQAATTPAAAADVAKETKRTPLDEALEKTVLRTPGSTTNAPRK